MCVREREWVRETESERERERERKKRQAYFGVRERDRE